MQKMSKYQDLLNLALDTAKLAYSPYSKFQVGAAVLYKDGSIYKGCNVENASYGLSLCAERNAISSAVADGNKSEIVAIAIASPNSKQCYPCGACRQWIVEFTNNADIILEDNSGSLLVYSISDLLPNFFKL
jgi:cytidine deaminase